MSDRTIEAQLRDLRGRLDRLESGKEVEAHGALEQEAWRCAKCGIVLGYYDEAKDVLRVRQQNNITYIHVGIGGYVEVVCRQCSQINGSHWEPVAGVSPELLLPVVDALLRADSAAVERARDALGVAPG